jgi:TonB family protein
LIALYEGYLEVFGLMPLRKLIAVLLVLFPGLGFATPVDSSRNQKLLAVPEGQVWPSPKRDTEFSAIAHTTRSSCSATQPPQELATPSPLLDRPSKDEKIKVSFIIGTDGRVHSPFILESAGSTADQVVLDTVRSWRYRPATCNGVPTEAEARIGFSSR